MEQRAILFLNLGGPETQADVRDFLYRLFSDPEIIRVRFSPLRKLIAWAISTSREKESKELYMKMGGGSPIRRLTDQQSAATEKILAAKGFQAMVRTAFTCSAPLVEDVVKDLAAQGVRTFLNFPLYPQYSLTTTKGAHDRTRAAVEKLAPGAKLFEIHSWPTHPSFVQAHADLINGEAAKFDGGADAETHLVFSAHSIPERLVTELGDPYKKQMIESAEAIVKKAAWKGPWTLAWQSKLGPIKWLEPATKDVVEQLGKAGTKRVLVDPIAFVTDHIETLVELDEELAETAKESGVKEFRRVRGLNDDPTFISALADIASAQKDFWN